MVLLYGEEKNSTVQSSRVSVARRRGGGCGASETKRHTNPPSGQELGQTGRETQTQEEVRGGMGDMEGEREEEEEEAEEEEKGPSERGKEEEGYGGGRGVWRGWEGEQAESWEAGQVGNKQGKGASEDNVPFTRSV